MPRPNPRHRINLPKPNERLENLVVARESDSHDIPLLEGMIMQTLERLPDLPGRDTLRGLGVRPVTHPHEVGGRVRKKLGSTAVFFAVEGTACLYSRGSAAKDENIERENGFVLLLCEVLKEHKPRNVYVATFSRLVRSIYHSGPVRSALEEAGSRLHYDGGSIDFAEDGEADLKWAVMAAFAAMERRAVLTRLMLGRCARHRRNKWIYQPRTVPMGYKLVRGRIKVDEDARQAVAKAIRLMGDPDVSSRELALALGAIGVLTPQRGDRKWTYSNWAWNGEPYVPLRLRPRDGNGQPSFDFNEGYVRADYIDGPSEFSADDDPHDLDDDPHDLDAELQALTGEEDYDGSGSGPATDGGFSQGNLTGDWAGRDGELGLGLDDGLQDFEDELIDDEATPAGFDELGEFGGVGGLDDFDDDENPDDDDDESDDDTDIDIEGPDSTTPETAARSEAGVPAPTTDSGARAPRRRRDHKRDLGDFASPDRIGRRIIELLDLWQHGTITLELASPLPNVKKYAE